MVNSPAHCCSRRAIGKPTKGTVQTYIAEHQNPISVVHGCHSNLVCLGLPRCKKLIENREKLLRDFFGRFGVV